MSFIHRQIGIALSGLNQLKGYVARVAMFCVVEK